jgi:uncharacterized protein YnzC (UPF0291/DUF896 family)
MSHKQRDHQTESQNGLTDREGRDALVQNEKSDIEQVAYRRDYLEQLKRLACPGCSEDEPVF